MRRHELWKKLLRYDKSDPGTGASEPEIAKAEHTLGLRIVGGYRAFLRRYGWGGVDHLDLYGLGQDVPRYLDLVRVTLSERVDMEPALPPHLLPIMNDGAGNLYCVDTRASVRGQDPVVFWDHEAARDQTPEVLAPSFEDWLADLLDELESR